MVFSDHRLSNELAQDPAYGLLFATYRLAEDGLWFQRLYAIGNRTTWGCRGW